jgi:hypothetical protein
VSTFSVMVNTPVDAHQVLSNLFQQQVKPHTRQGKRGVITWHTESTYLRLKHRGAFHGYILDAFSNQVWFKDETTGRQFRYAKEVWKEYLKQQFLPPRMEEYRKRTGEIAVRKRRPSTEDLTDDEYSLFLDQVCAFGITELGIEFPEESY